MAGSEESRPNVAVPHRIDRRMRLGPFPSARDALKFVGYAAAGSTLVPFLGALAWLPFLGVGFAVSVHRPEEGAVDERIVAYLRWKMRALDPPAVPEIGPVPESSGRRTLIALPNGKAISILRAGGVPIAFLPPAEARRLFEQYGEIVRGLERAYMVVGTEPMPSPPFRPPSDGAEGADRDARRGYGELVDRLCGHRRRRVLLVTLWSPAADAASLRRLREESERLVRELGALGIPAEPLEGTHLKKEARRLGWSPGRAI